MVFRLSEKHQAKVVTRQKLKYTKYLKVCLILCLKEKVHRRLQFKQIRRNKKKKTIPKVLINQTGPPPHKQHNIPLQQQENKVLVTRFSLPDQS